MLCYVMQARFQQNHSTLSTGLLDLTLTKKLKGIIEEWRKFVRVTVIDWNSVKMSILNEGWPRTRNAHIQHVRYPILLKCYQSLNQSLCCSQKIHYRQ